MNLRFLENMMDLGHFSVSLSVKDISVSKAFYQKLGFEVIDGNEADKWLILQHGQVKIGLFQDMFPENILTFNPKDVRSIQQKLKEAGISLSKECDSEGAGAAHIALTDPDGNQILIDQF